MNADRVVSAADNDSLRGAFNSVGREECQVLGLKGVLVGEIGATGLGLRLAGQTGVVHFEASRLDDTDVSWDTVAEFHLKYVALLIVYVQFSKRYVVQSLLIKLFVKSKIK